MGKVERAHWKFVSDDLDTSGLSRKDVLFDSRNEILFSDLQSQQNIVGILVGDVNGTF